MSHGQTGQRQLMEHRGISSPAANPALLLSSAHPQSCWSTRLGAWNTPGSCQRDCRLQRERWEGGTASQRFTTPAAHCRISPAPSQLTQRNKPRSGAGDDLQSFLWEGIFHKGSSWKQPALQNMPFDWPFILVYTANCCRCISYHEN